MTTIKSILRRLGAPVRGEATWRETEDELRFHIEMRARDNIETGMSPEDAVADAMRRFGDTEDTPRPVPTYDKDGRTPVERLISDESSDETTK